MSIELKSPYFNLELYDNINLEPKQLNNNLYINLKENLKKKVLNKCNKYGYVTNIFKINEYSDGMIIPETFNGNIKFNIKYTARLCNVIENTAIVCHIEHINNHLIKAVNGPVIIIIKLNDINKTYFNINNKGKIMYKENTLKIGDYIVSNIIAQKFNYNDTRICSIGTMERVATSSEKKNYFDENVDSDENLLMNQTEDNKSTES